MHSIDRVHERLGLGIEGWVDGHALLVGNRALLARAGVAPADDFTAEVAEMVADRLSPVWIAVDGKARAVVGIGDPLRPQAARTIARLRQRGIEVEIIIVPP